MARPVLSASVALSLLQVAHCMVLATPEAAKLFGRFAESQLYLDKHVGACCHSACSDCEWRDPEGGYRFDVLKSTVPKWLPCYLVRDFDDDRGCHVPTWSKALFPDGEGGRLSSVEFADRFAALDFAMPMGPKGAIKEDDAPSDEAIASLWSWLCDGEERDDLDAATVLRRLQDMSLVTDREGAIGEGPDYVDWKSFAKALGAAPFERW